MLLGNGPTRAFARESKAPSAILDVASNDLQRPRRTQLGHVGDRASAQPHAPPCRLPGRSPVAPDDGARRLGAPSGAGDDRPATRAHGRRARRRLRRVARRARSARAVPSRSPARPAGAASASAPPTAPQDFRIDPIPRLIDAARVARAVGRRRPARARARAVRARRLRRSGGSCARASCPARAIDGADHYEPLLDGIGRAHRRRGSPSPASTSCATATALQGARGQPAHAVGHRLRRGHARSAARAPAAARAACDVRSLDAGLRHCSARRCAPPRRTAPARTRRRAAQRRRAATRPSTSTRTIAAALGAAARARRAAVVRGGRLYARLPDGEPAVDVVYRRTDEDRLRDERGELTHVARAAARARGSRARSACVNAFGTGVADDKLVHAYVEDMVRFYLGEEPLLRSVPTYDPGAARDARDDPRPDRRARDQAAQRPRRLRRRDRAARARRGRAQRPPSSSPPRPSASSRRRWSCSRATRPSPTGACEPRHIDLRPFAIARGERGATCSPAGSRASPSTAGALVVNSSQNGGSKDTWVLA